MKYYNSIEVAYMLGLTKRAVNYMCQKGELEGAYKDGYRWKIPADLVETKVGNRGAYDAGTGKLYEIEDKDKYMKQLDLSHALGIGRQEFDVIREHNCFYIDKTHFIKEWWDNDKGVTLITRPRRFGKTLNMSMLECFFSNRYENRADLFEGLAISKNERLMKLQGTFPVIQLTFGGIKSPNYEGAFFSICWLLEEIWLRHKYLIDDHMISDDSIVRYKEVLKELKARTNIACISDSLRILSDFLYEAYGKKVIILLDEYDTPMHEAYSYGYWNEMAGFIRMLFNNTFKINSRLERGLITGITRLGKESLFSNMNNLIVANMLSNKYSCAFGFTEREVFLAMEARGYKDKNTKARVKDWYDGFVIGRTRDIYNPWSVVNYLDSGDILNYWANTGTNRIAGDLICKGSQQLKNDFMTLLEGGSIRKEIDDSVVFEHLDEDENAVWSLLLASGYLRAENVLIDGTVKCNLTLVNKEVASTFNKLVQGWFKKGRAAYNAFVNALLDRDDEAMNEYMTEVIRECFSYFDGRVNPTEHSQTERFYHGFVLGLLVDLREQYLVRSNRESGFGRYDVMIIPKDVSKHAFILEFKVRSKKKEASLEEAVQSALKQIEEKKYATELLAMGIQQENIHCYGIAFEGKEVLIQGE